MDRFGVSKASVIHLLEAKRRRPSPTAAYARVVGRGGDPLRRRQLAHSRPPRDRRSA
jgi:hypothetical protein